MATRSLKFCSAHGPLEWTTWIMFKKCASVSLLFFRELDIKAASGNQIDLMVIFYDCILKLLFICGISHVMTFNLSKKPYQKTLKWTGSTQSFLSFIHLLYYKFLIELFSPAKCPVLGNVISTFYELF